MSKTLEQRIKRHEGLRLKPYQDTLGYTTVGYGHKIISAAERKKFANGITQEQADNLFKDDLGAAWHYAIVSIGTTFHRLDTPQQEVIVEMIYQLGLKGVLKFKKMLNALDKGDYETAADQMLDSLWHQQTPQRCEELSAIMRTRQQNEAVA